MKLLMVNNKLVSRNGNLLSTDLSPTGGGGMQSVTYAELKALRDNGQLVAGRQYRITDYVTTTTQENTRSAGHPFDIIVTADSESVLNENARAIQHEGGGEVVEVPTGTLKTEVIDGDKALVEGAVTKYFDIYEDFGEDKNTDYKAGDIFVEYGYAENNLGVTVPVLYKTDVEMMEEGADYADTYFYVGRYEYNGETYDRWRKIESSGEGALTWDSASKVYALTNIIVDNSFIEITQTHFDNAKLSAWKIKYSLDNDATRFYWAKTVYWFTTDLATEKVYILSETITVDGQEYFKTTHSNILSIVANPTSAQEVYYYDGETAISFEEDGDSFDDYGEEGGKGVIYYMKDEWDNECPYDFKNIQFVRTADWFAEHEDWCNNVLGYVPEEDMWFYTFTWVNENDDIQDLTLIGNTLKNDESFISGVSANKMDLTTTYDIYIEGGENSVLALSNNIIVNSFYHYADMGSYNGCSSNTFGNGCAFNTFGNYCSFNTFGNGCAFNTFGNGCDYNAFGNGCNSNTFGDTCRYNTFSSGCRNNTFSKECNSNAFGNYCYSNTFSKTCRSNTFGDTCYSNTFNSGCDYNTFGNECHSNAFGAECNYNTFGNGCQDNTFDNYCNSNTFGDACRYNTFSSGYQSSTFGNHCDYNTFSDYCRYIILENGVTYIRLETDTAGDYSYYVQNVKVRLSVHGSSTANPLVLNVDRNNDFETEVVSINKETIEVQYET